MYACMHENLRIIYVCNVCNLSCACMYVAYTIEFMPIHACVHPYKHIEHTYTINIIRKYINTRMHTNTQLHMHRPTYAYINLDRHLYMDT